MLRLPISCESCGQVWVVPGTFSLYEQLAVESCPCPRCGAYTLCYREPAGDSPSFRLRPLGRRRTLQTHR